MDSKHRFGNKKEAFFDWSAALRLGLESALRNEIAILLLTPRFFSISNAHAE
jgi:hypothetical protein